MRSVLLGFLAAALLAQTADAQPNMTANALVPACKEVIAVGEGRQKENTDTALERGVCIGIVAALAAAARAFPPGFSTCVPQGATYGQMIRVVVAYIERYPQRMHEDLRQLTTLALHEAWPCEGVR
jgi:Rap1a immunity proteins